jgi:DNA repair protein RadC
MCAPFTEVRIDEEKFRACVALADQIGPLTTPTAIYKLIRQYCVSQPQEVFLVISLDLHGHLRGIDEVARGQIDRVNVGIDDVMRAALGAALARQAKGFVIAHCHPSGKATPSQADKDLTKAIEKARKPFGNNLKLVDHIVVGLDQFTSIRLRKLFRAKR